MSRGGVGRNTSYAGEDMDGSIMCEGIGIGGVPNKESLKQLQEEGVGTLLDAREDGEGGPEVSEMARELGLRYVRVPISRRRVDLGQVESFRKEVSDPANGKVYAFSGGGKRPAGVLCFLACARMGDSVIEVFHKAKKYGCAIDREFALKKFILDFYSSHRGDMLNNHFQHPSHA